jgi:hypothetical protein
LSLTNSTPTSGKCHVPGNNSLAPGITLHYTSWKELAEDINQSRIDGGVHDLFDQEPGASQGRRVAGAEVGLGFEGGGPEPARLRGFKGNQMLSTGNLAGGSMRLAECMLVTSSALRVRHNKVGHSQILALILNLLARSDNLCCELTLK